ncbi:DUF981 family protein [Paenibacillus sp. TC-CSREp1]|uniref:DUF981 family protein n=1 Tax=Paenibacillus sp. TC-CSREp1 TaxID=3410089 RepID=UPI003CFA62E7
MIIDWSVTSVYNTLMSVATGVALLMILKFSADVVRSKVTHLEGWAVGFGITGFILTLTGAHMTLTWPLSKIGFPFDDIIFGEPVLAFGVLLLGATVILWRKSNQYHKAGLNMEDSNLISGKLRAELPYLLRPLSYFAAAMGLALISISFAGVGFQLFAAPPEEPISGWFADYPMIEATFMSLLIAITGVGACIFPFILKDTPNPKLVRTVNYLWLIAGIIFVGFGVLNYFTHIGLIVHTMK